MAKQTNKPFNGTEGVYVGRRYLYSKMKFNIVGDDIKVTASGYLLKNRTILIEDFKRKTLLEALEEIQAVTHDNEGLGRHFENGLRDVYHWFDLDFGYMSKFLKPFEPNKQIKEAFDYIFSQL